MNANTPDLVRESHFLKRNSIFIYINGTVVFGTSVSCNPGARDENAARLSIWKRVALGEPVQLHGDRHEAPSETCLL